MSYNFDDLNAGGQVKIGTGIVPAIKEGDEKINGSRYCQRRQSIACYICYQCQ